MIQFFRDIKPVVDVFAVGVAATSIFLGYWNYRRSVQIKKAEWLHALSSRFFETPNYKRIRRILDWEQVNPEEFNLLQGAALKIVSGEKDMNKEEQEIIEDLVDYLNFFELIGSLVEMRQMNLSTVDKMFNYYIQNIRSHDWLVMYIRYDGFERMEMLLKKLAGGKR